tara:strand:+ start:1470 stop:1961 length:492 start_codon:yes stop_codon:yes gene_type:complete
MTYLFSKSLGENPQTTITVNTSVQTTPTSGNSYVTVNGSQTTYTPAANTDKVVYEIGFYVEALNKASFQHLILEHDTNNNNTWSTISQNFGKNFGAFGAGQYLRDYLYYRFIIPSWSGTRGLRLRSSAHTAIHGVNYHAVTEWDGSGSITNRFCNTSLLIYSV